MPRQTRLYIPSPCHEDWNKMTAAEHGRFCTSCCKQVVDFTLMTDQQILNYLSARSGKLCGRFDSEQLQRPLVETKMAKKKSWWMALTMPLLLLFERSEAQGSVAVITGDTTLSTIEKEPQIMGKLTYPSEREITIKGTVVDEKNEPIPFATISEKGALIPIAADTDGNFVLRTNSNRRSFTILVSAVGFESAERKIDVSQDTVATITVQMRPSLSGELIVVTAGAISSYEPVMFIDTIKTAVKKIVGISNFKIYPNPAFKGRLVHIETANAGKYQLQLLDNQSRLTKIEELNAESENYQASFTVPTAIAAGVYYLRLIDEEKKKQYTEKLIIQ